MKPINELTPEQLHRRQKFAFFTFGSVLVIGLGVLIYGMSHAEISSARYQQLTEYVENYPQLKPTIEQYYADDKISSWEYDRINAYYKKLHSHDYEIFTKQQLREALQ